MIKITGTGVIENIRTITSRSNKTLNIADIRVNLRSPIESIRVYSFDTLIKANKGDRIHFSGEPRSFHKGHNISVEVLLDDYSVIDK